MAKITWTHRYSETMKDDKHGRWARVGYAGTMNKVFVKNKKCNFEVAWIDKLRDEKGKWHLKMFVVKTMFPATLPKNVYIKLEEAQSDVQKALDWFMEMLNDGKEKINDYIITTNSDQRYTNSMGVYVVSAKSKNKALGILRKYIKRPSIEAQEIIDEVILLKPQKEEIAFWQSASYQ